MSKKNPYADRPYEVGKGKPPRTTRFKEGQSGNPGGRRKGTKNFKTVLMDAANQLMEFRENGKVVRATRMEALILRQFQIGFSGSARAIEDFMDRMERYESCEPTVEMELSEEDRNLLDRAFGRRKGDPILLKPHSEEGTADEQENGAIPPHDCGDEEADDV
jgi:hypothetical protein